MLPTRAAAPRAPFDRLRASGFFFALAVSISSLAPAAQRPDLAAVERLVVTGANDFRRGEGAAPLAVDAKLSAAARGLAAHMARTDRYGHEADGRTPAQRVQAQGYTWCMVAENIAMQYYSGGFATDELAQRFVQGWVDSPGHRRNLLERDATQTGVAIAHSARSGRYYAVQVFGRPMRAGRCG